MSDSSNTTFRLNKVVLYKHGTGYFERHGEVDGPATVEIVCGHDEIDDMLKSLLAISSKGLVDAITYDSSKTLEYRLSEFGFDLTGIRGLCDLLGQMKGIPITINLVGEVITGRMLGLDESEEILDNHVSKHAFLTVYTGESTFRRIKLAEVTSINIDDESMASELSQQLELLFQNVKKKDRKSLKIVVSHTGALDLFVAYSIPCPIWKTSYRLVFQDNDQKLLLQGMAIVDNVQEEDWNDVQIVLVSSHPISFIQPLYDPVQPERPTIASQGVSSSGPVTAQRTRREAVFQDKLSAPGGMGGAPAPQSMAVGSGKMKQLALSSFEDSGAWGSADFAEGMSTGMLAASIDAAELQVEAADSGQQFEYRIQKRVTVPRNSSALLPIVQQHIEGIRLSLFNESKNPRFPFAAVKLTNNTGLTLEGGPVTVMESDAYAGEALIDTTKPGDERYLLYAVDQSVPVVVRSLQENQPYWQVRSVGGMLYLDYKSRTGKRYEIENLADRERTVLVEYPITKNWKLSDGIKADETTESFYRFNIEVKARKAHAVDIWEETMTCRQFALVSNAFDPNTIKWLVAQNFANKEGLEHLKDLLGKHMELTLLRSDMALAKTHIQQGTADAERARQNLTTLGATNQRYRQALDTAEDLIQSAQQRLTELTDTYRRKEQEFNQMVVNDFTSTIS